MGGGSMGGARSARRSATRIAVLGIGVVALIGTSVPAANAAWSAIQDVSPSTPTSTQPDVAVGGNGDDVAVWLRGDGLNARVEVDVRHGTGNWSGETFASPAGIDAD